MIETIYNGESIYNIGSGGGGGGSIPLGTYYFFNLQDLTSSGSATLENTDYTGYSMTKVSNAVDYIVLPFNGFITDFSKITLSFKRIINRNSSAESLFLYGDGEEVLTTKTLTAISTNDCEMINIPDGVNYTLSGNGHEATYDGQKFICSNSTYNSNAIDAKYYITKNYIDAEDTQHGILGRIDKGLNSFGGFKIIKHGTGTSSKIGIGKITIKIE